LSQIMRPSEVILPVLFSRMINLGQFACDGVNCLSMTVFEVVTTLTSHSKIIQIAGAAF
jgi:hypothetical protein